MRWYWGWNQRAAAGRPGTGRMNNLDFIRSFVFKNEWTIIARDDCAHKHPTHAHIYSAGDRGTGILQCDSNVQLSLGHKTSVLMLHDMANLKSPFESHCTGRAHTGWKTITYTGKKH